MKYKFPKPEDNLLTIMKEIGKREKSNYFLLSLQDFTLFERCWCLRGYENVLMDLYYREKEINYLLDGITDFNMVMSPEIWRKFFKERYKKIWRIYKDKGLPVFHHSCGNIIEIIPDLIGIGLNVITTVQPEAMNPEELSKRFGGKLSFLGGISTQNTMPFGTPQDVRNEVISRIRVLGKNNGYIISLSHEVTSDCKPENFNMLVSMLDKYERGEINTC